jgi:hypothetical protein
MLNARTKQEPQKLKIPHEELQEQLEPKQCAPIQNFCFNNNLTVKSVFLTLLGKILYDTKQNQTVGVVSSGRNQGLSDPLGSMGLFWNIIPVQIDTRSGFKKRCVSNQAKLVELEPFCRFPLTEIESFSGTKTTFSTTFNFTNFHNSAGLVEYSSEEEFTQTHSLDNYGYDLNVSINVNQDQSISIGLISNLDDSEIATEIINLLVNEIRTFDPQSMS